jgi:DNA-binding NarL/FixJ family response regulator
MFLRGANSMKSISVAVVDDHPMLLAGVTTLFENSEGFNIVGSGASAADAIDMMKHRPDVIILDLNMPGNAFDAISKISAKASGTKVVAFTASNGIEHAVHALEAGANGYILKGSTADELLHGVRAVHAGETYIAPTFASKVISALRNASLRKAAVRAIKLSIREEQIVRLLLRGRTNKEIATALGIREKTVKHYMTILMQKLQARNRLEVVIAAQKLDVEACSQSFWPQ